jgi:hypothetical protein
MVGMKVVTVNAMDSQTEQRARGEPCYTLEDSSDELLLFITGIALLPDGYWAGLLADNLLHNGPAEARP